MRYISIVAIWFLVIPVSAQTVFPSFLKGTWKVENKELYERWDYLNEGNLRGISYTLSDGGMMISEYLDISVNSSGIIYTATVPGQNNGKGISFTLTRSDSTYSFENPKHDFPKKIVYKILTDTEVIVEVSDGNQGGFTYLLEKQKVESSEKNTTTSNPDYDSSLAKKLGADDYGMKKFILVILKTGSNDTKDTDFINSCFNGHMANINRLVEEGKLIVAGPMGNSKNNYRGIFILNLASIEEAEKVLQTDPAVKEKLLDADLYDWYGSAALPEYLKHAGKIWKIKPN